MKHIELVCEWGDLPFGQEANKLLERGYEPIGSISVVHTGEDDGLLFTQPFGKPGMNDEYHRKTSEDL